MRVASFCPFRNQLTFFIPVRERAFVNRAVIDHLLADPFAVLSIAEHSCLSSLKRAHLLITMGLVLTEIS